MRDFFISTAPHWALFRLSLLLLCCVSAANACDTYDGNLVTIPSVVVAGTTYTNVIATVTAQDLRGVGSNLANPSVAPLPDSYDSTTGLLTIPCVYFGSNTYTNVTVALPVGHVVSVGKSFKTSNIPVLAPVFPLADAYVAQYYNQSVVFKVIPQSGYTYMIDSLAVGNGVPTGMSLDMNGVLSGTAFATGAADVNGYQIPHTYNFGVCAVDTLTRNTTTPCPQTSITIRPITVAASTAGAGSGTVTISPAANPCGTNCYSGYASNDAVTVTATPASGSAFTSWSSIGWSGCPSSNSCTVRANGKVALTATFDIAAPLTGTWVGQWAWAGPAVNGCPANDGGSFSMTLTQNGTSFSGSINAAGIQQLDNNTCAVTSTGPSGGSVTGTISGSTVNLTFNLTGNQLGFTANATLIGNSLKSTSLARTTGGSGSFTITRQ